MWGEVRKRVGRPHLEKDSCVWCGCVGVICFCLIREAYLYPNRR